MSNPNNENAEEGKEVTYPGVYVEEVQSGIQPVAGVRTTIAAFVGKAKTGPVDDPVKTLSWRDFEQQFGGLSVENPLSYAIQDFFQNGGEQAYVVRVGLGLGEDASSEIFDDLMIGNEESKIGLFALEKVDLFNILCIPPMAKEIDVGKKVIAAAASYCERRRAFLIIDGPQSWRTFQIAERAMNDPIHSLGTDSKNAAVYFPRILKPNPERNDRMDAFAACGAVAGIIARTDVKRGVWKAPAGIETVLKGATGLTVELTDNEIGALNTLSCNCLRFFPNSGNVIWGARTLQGNDQTSSEWKYVHVRRLALYLEESLYRGTQWAVFEHNGKALWSRIKRNIENFMHSLWREGAFVGQSPSEAYFVRCDRSTMTQNDIDNGRLIIEVGVAPLRPAEFVIIRIQQKVETLE